MLVRLTRGGRRSLLGGAWLATHWLLRESAVWRDRNTDEVRSAQRDADYAYRLAVDPPAAKELRLFGLAGWTIERFVDAAHAPARAAVRRRRGCASGRCVWSLLLVLAANVARVLVARRRRGRRHGSTSARVVIYAQSAVGTSMIAFGGLNWALDGAAAPVAAVLRLEPAMAPAGALAVGRPAADGLPAREIRFRDVTFAYPARRRRCSTASTSRFPPGRRSRSSGRTAPARRRWPSCCAGSTTRRPARSRSTASTCATSTSTRGGRGSTAVFQDFIRFELPLRDNVAPARRARRRRCARRSRRPARRDLADLDTMLARGYDGGTDLSGGQWQRVALARALCAVRLGAGVVLLDEPTAQLDVRGEAEIFERILAATRHCTTILISHRFSTVRHADRICVLEHGRSSSSARTTS